MRPRAFPSAVEEEAEELPLLLGLVMESRGWKVGSSAGSGGLPVGGGAMTDGVSRDGPQVRGG